MKKGWSPEQIAGRLRYEHNRGETGMSVSHEAICTWIYVRPRRRAAISRYLRPVALPDGHDADPVKTALFDAARDLAAHLRKSLT